MPSKHALVAPRCLHFPCWGPSALPRQEYPLFAALCSLTGRQFIAIVARLAKPWVRAIKFEGDISTGAPHSSVDSCACSHCLRSSWTTILAALAVPAVLVIFSFWLPALLATCAARARSARHPALLRRTAHAVAAC